MAKRTGITASDYEPLYVGIARDLREAIIARTLSPNLLFDEVLAQARGVAPGTARRALGILEEEGWIVRVPGKGSQIRYRPAKRLRDGRARLEGGPQHQFMRADFQGMDGLRVVDFHATEAQLPRIAVPEVAACFPEATTLIVRSRRYEAEGIPYFKAVNYIPRYLFTRIAPVLTRPDTGKGGIWARMAEAGNPVVQADEYIDTRRATKAERRELDIPSGIPVFEIYRVAQDPRGRVVDLAVITLPGDRWRLHYAVRDRGTGGGQTQPVFSRKTTS